MGYFDGLTNGNFKKDGSGQTVFYPWGVFGKGRVLSDEATENKVRGFVRRYYQVTLPLIIGVGVILGWVYLFLLVPIFAGWFYLRTKTLVAGCPLSESKLTLGESYANSAVTHNTWTLWLLFICSVLFVATGIWMALSANSAGDRVMGWIVGIFFGACSVAIGYMLKVKRA
jgi:hypothetical protein